MSETQTLGAPEAMPFHHVHLHKNVDSGRHHTCRSHYTETQAGAHVHALDHASGTGMMSCVCGICRLQQQRDQVVMLECKWWVP
jgi:hypothetical protein